MYGCRNVVHHRILAAWLHRATELKCVMTYRIKGTAFHTQSFTLVWHKSRKLYSNNKYIDKLITLQKLCFNFCLIHTGKDVTHNVITDPVIQQETGDTMWKAFTHSITPRWFGGSTPPPSPTKETPTPPPKMASPETGEAEIRDPAVEGQDMRSITNEEYTPQAEKQQDAKDSQVIVKDRKDTARSLDAEEVSEEQQNEQKEIVELTLAVEEP